MASKRQEKEKLIYKLHKKKDKNGTCYYCFTIYNYNQDGYISQEEMYQMLKNSLVWHPSEEDPDESIKELVEHCIEKMKCLCFMNLISAEHRTKK